MAVWDTNEYGKGKWGQGKGVEEGMGGWITVVGRETTEKRPSGPSACED